MRPAPRRAGAGCPAWRRSTSATETQQAAGGQAHRQGWEQGRTPTGQPRRRTSPEAFVESIIHERPHRAQRRARHRRSHRLRFRCLGRAGARRGLCQLAGAGGPGSRSGAGQPAHRLGRRQLPPLSAARHRSRRHPYRDGRPAGARELRPLRARGAADAAGRPARAAGAGLGRAAGLHAADRPGLADHDGRHRARTPHRQPPAVRTGAGRAARLAAGLAPGRAAALRRSPAAARTGAVPRLVPGAPPRRCRGRSAAPDPGPDLRSDRRPQPGRAQGLRAPRLHAS